MFGRSRTEMLKENASAAADVTVQLAADKKFREQLLSAAGHAVSAQQRARSRLGFVAAANRLAADKRLRAELVQMTRDLRAARAHAAKRRSHRLRNTLLLLAAAGGATVAFVPRTRRWLLERAGAPGMPSDAHHPRTIEASIEVEAPVARVYNQWTQFEQFPQFMDGVEEVQQLDDTRLRWVANVAGKRAEWTAKILEQHPDRQISWISEDGKKTRGTVTFESLSPSSTLVRLSMSYQAEGVSEAVGSTLGLDRRRVTGDLERFKHLIETQGQETGAWRADISEGSTDAVASPAQGR
jgi:uncharacterized membrane protein